MARMKITKGQQAGYLSISYEEQGELRARTFYLPRDGGRVLEYGGFHGEYRQVCKGLERFGETLTCGNREALPDLIRAEYRRMRRVEASKTSYEYCISTED